MQSPASSNKACRISSYSSSATVLQMQPGAVVSELSASDRRIRFFDFPKGPRKGEIHRHQTLQQARGRFVAYLGDDDCWMPNHLDVLDELLTDADFGHTIQVGIDAERRIVVMPADLQNPAFRRRMLTDLFNRFDLTFAGHTLEAYHRLPHGWRTTPPEFPWTDLTCGVSFWRSRGVGRGQPYSDRDQYLDPFSVQLSDPERADDLTYWRAQAAPPEFQESLWRLVAQRFAAKSVAFEHGLWRNSTFRHVTGKLRHLRRLADGLARR